VRLCLLVNPAGGGGKSARLAPGVEGRLRGLGLQVRRVDTEGLDHARRIAASAARDGERVVTLSGDGLVGAVVDALRAVPDAVLGVLPGGRGNDLARVLGISDDAIAACDIVGAGATRAMDVGVVHADGDVGDGRAFVGIASVGFDSDANRIANEAPAWLGGLAYAWGALRALAAWRPAHFEIALEPGGERFEFSGYSVIVANSRAYGGGMHVAPDAMLDDGLLDVIAIEAVSRARFLLNLPRVFRGTHVRLPTVRVFRAAQVEVAADRSFEMYADGDPIASLPARVSALPAAVRVLVPVSGSGEGAFASPPPPAATVTSKSTHDVEATLER
jgi:YegS/Rv2252/BmrU family lipid kinase